MYLPGLNSFCFDIKQKTGEWLLETAWKADIPGDFVRWKC